MEGLTIQENSFGGVSSFPPLYKSRAWAPRNMSSNCVCPKKSRRVYSSREVLKYQNNNNEIVVDALKTDT